MKWSKLLCGVVSLASCITSSVFAYDQPIVNLGYTSFFDGSPPAGPGFYFQDYFQYYSSNRFNDRYGNKLPIPRTKLDVVADIPQVIYLSTKKVLGGSLGVSALLPWVVGASVDDGMDHFILNSQNGPGDLFIGPAIQYDPIMRANGQGPLFVQRIEFDVVVPVGKYDSTYAVNPSSNFWSVNPYWAATLWITPKWTSSVRFHYLWNGKNNDPSITFGPLVRSTQAGQAVFANFATEYSITEKFFLGINGYFFDQFTDTKADGVNVPGRREKIWAIGPGMLYSIDKNQFLFFNLYSEQDARNRPQGTNCILRYAVHF